MTSKVDKVNNQIYFGGVFLRLNNGCKQSNRDDENLITRYNMVIIFFLYYNIKEMVLSLVNNSQDQITEILGLFTMSWEFEVK